MESSYTTFPFNLRIATFADRNELSVLFQSTIRTINKQNYTYEEIEDWSSCGESLQKWGYLINNLHFTIAENKNKQIVGFCAIRSDGYLHSMFVHKDYQKQGIATLLLAEAEQYAKEQSLKEIYSEVSITASSFFLKHGYKIEAKQQRKAYKLHLTNYLMRKRLIT